jgi:hypothetical protein
VSFCPKFPILQPLKFELLFAQPTPKMAANTWAWSLVAVLILVSVALSPKFPIFQSLKFELPLAQPVPKMAASAWLLLVVVLLVAVLVSVARLPKFLISQPLKSELLFAQPVPKIALFLLLPHGRRQCLPRGGFEEQIFISLKIYSIISSIL